MNKTWYALRDFQDKELIAVIEVEINEENGEIENTIMIDEITNEDIFNK